MDEASWVPWTLLKLRRSWLLPLAVILIAILFGVVLGHARPTLDWVNVLPGVPVAPADRKRFGEDFWPALYSAGIAGAITGLLIGAFLLTTQLIMDRRRSRREQRDALEGFLGNVERYAMANQRSTYIPSTAVEAAPYGANLVEQEASGKPLKTWWDVFPDRREQLNHVRMLVFFNLGFRVYASKLDHGLQLWARQFLNSIGMGPDAEIEQAIARYAIAKLLEVEQELAILSSADVLHATQLEQANEFLMNQPLYVRAAENYQNMLAEVEVALRSLLPTSLRAPDSANLDQEQNGSEETIVDNANADN